MDITIELVRQILRRALGFESFVATFIRSVRADGKATRTAQIDRERPPGRNTAPGEGAPGEDRRKAKRTRRAQKARRRQASRAQMARETRAGAR